MEFPSSPRIYGIHSVVLSSVTTTNRGCQESSVDRGVVVFDCTVALDRDLKTHRSVHAEVCLGLLGFAVCVL